MGLPPPLIIQNLIRALLDIVKKLLSAAAHKEGEVLEIVLGRHFLLTGRMLGCEALLNELLGGANMLGTVNGVRRLLLLGIALVLTGSRGVIHSYLPILAVGQRFQFFFSIPNKNT